MPLLNQGILDLLVNCVFHCNGIKFTSRSWKLELPRFEDLMDFLPMFTGKFCCWIQNHNLPVKLGKILKMSRFEVLVDYLPVFTGKFCCWFQNHNLPVTVGKKLEFSKYTGKFRHWIQNRNLPVNLEFLCLTFCARVGW